MEPAAAGAAEPPVVFRHGKRRKMYRQRQPDPKASGEPADPAIEAPAPADASIEDEAEEDGLSVAEVLRRRQARKARLRGVEFRSEDTSRSGPAGDSYNQALVLRDAAAAGIVSAETSPGMNRRFAPQTGLVGDVVNRHM